MTLEQHILLVDLLHQREAEFVRIWKCEEEIRRLLPGKDFPFPPPPDLPSRHKPQKDTGRKKGQAKAMVPPRIRPLEPHNGETAYRIRFLYNGEEQASFQLSRDLLELVTGLATSDFTPLSVETVMFRNMDDFTVVDTIWQAATP